MLFRSSVIYIMPLMSVFFGFVWPQGLSLYWMTAALVMVGQQYHLMGWGSLRMPTWLPGHDRVTSLSYSAADFGTPVAATPGAPMAASSNGARRSGRGASVAATAPAGPGRGRVPARAQKKGRRRR